jgi:hypothetical protein
MKAGGKPQELEKAHPAFETNFGASDIFDALEPDLESKIKNLESEIKNLKMGIKQ